MTAADALAKIPYLRALPSAAREDLARQCVFQTIERGGSLFREGDAPTGVFLILEGRIKLLRSSADGREQVLHEEGPGATLAEVPAFDGDGFVGSAIAVEDARLFFVPRAPLLAALETSPASSLDVIRVLAARVRKLAGVVEDLSLRGVTERVAAYLWREIERAGGDTLELRITRDELATHVGTVREQASRAISRLKAAGVIEVRGRTLVVLDPAALKSAAGGAVQNGERHA
ncbi:MAG: Crp/Fnr family transcriptional regulator [Acidobacteriota bacterium]|nr:Crp/Fnr family transcriptional regulator [Acidobacteriota bacterium]